MFDTSPSAAAQIAGDRLPARARRAYRKYRHGAAAFQLALAVDGGIPWTYEPARRAGTVHVSGSLAQTASAELEVAAGRMPERPFVLVGQQYLADPGRSRGGLVPIGVNLCWWTPEVAGSLDSAGRCSCEHDTT